MKLEERVYKVKRRITLWFNRIRGNYSVKNKDGRIRAVIPDHHRQTVTYIKYFFTVVGLLSGFLVFTSVFVGFGLGIFIFTISSMLERIVFRHSYLFIHPLPNFDLDNEKWVGCGFGYAVPPNSTSQIPLVSMMVIDQEYAKKLTSLFLSWTGGKYHDEEKNIQVTVVVTKPNEYIFFFYPNPKRPVASRFFQSARDKLRQKSLTDEIREGHVTLVLGKRCSVNSTSYFPQFRKRYRSGVPVMFDFVLPPYGTPRSTHGIPSFVLFDFQIKNESELTRKDFVYEMVEGYKKIKGKWQGPPEFEPND
jgi:hypothetical protein